MNTAFLCPAHRSLSASIRPCGTLTRNAGRGGGDRGCHQFGVMDTVPFCCRGRGNNAARAAAPIVAVSQRSLVLGGCGQSVGTKCFPFRFLFRSIEKRSVSF